MLLTCGEVSGKFYVVDAADPTCEAQLEVTRGVLREIGAEAVPSLLLLNKADRLDPKRRVELLEKYPEAIVLSAHAPDDVGALRQTIIDHFETSMVEAQLLVPYAQQALISQIYENARVVTEEFDETGRKLLVRALPAAVAKLTRLLA